jgi:predicted HTH domain antitoxin
MEKIMSVRLEKEDLTFLATYSAEQHETRGHVLRELIENGRILTALQHYKRRHVSLGKASQIAGVSISEFIDLLSEFGVPSNLTLEDFKESLHHASTLKLKKNP